LYVLFIFVRFFCVNVTCCIQISFADWRRPYLNKEEPEILEQNLPSEDPFQIFDIWFKNVASKSNVSFEEVNSLLSTYCYVHRNNKPSSRMVLIKEYNKEGFSFYTNYDSRKGMELEVNPYAAVLFYWPKVDRQVRIEGKVKKLPEEMADEYWYSRPLKSRIGSKSSNQSSVVPNRQFLIDKRNELTKLAEEKGESAITRPSTWGGYCVVPSYFEFWQGQSDRVHDRIVFELDSDGKKWNRKRLSP
uniref:Pyridoxine-5'-phosphate oxidase n=1 Tax=Syphacia muris TaxID=451379 RepID=A0A0N5AMV3_9BILA